MTRFGRDVAVLLASICCAANAYAHTMPQSESRIVAEGRQVYLDLTLNLLELRDPVVAHQGRVDRADVGRDIEAIYASVTSHYYILAPGVPVETKLDGYELVSDHLLRMRIRYTFPEQVQTLTIASALGQIMPPDHKNMLAARVNGGIQESVLDAGSPLITLNAVQPIWWETALRFVRLGIEHIFTGYDHLAFLLGLLIATATIGSLIRVVTSFTIAHSVTLALATLNLVHLPTRLTESLIAVSIAWIAAENLFDFRLMPRHYITFIFGFVHGFGFSNVLREMDLPRAHLALSLFSFNAGVEVGQLAFVVLVFPLAGWAIASGYSKLKQVLSMGIAGLGVWWFVERVFLTR
jgi:HupE / UreJ protein